MKRGLALLLLLLLEALPASAQEGYPPPAPAPPPNVGLREDPNIDRVWFSPTAVTQPAGTLSFNDYELVFLGLTYGVSDNFQLSAIVLPPFTSDVPFVGFLSGKVSFPVGERVRLAGSLALGLVSVDEDQVGFGVAGAAVSFCTDGPCASLVSLYLYTGFSLTDENDNAIPLGYGASLLQRVGRHVKIVLDVGSGGALASNDVEFAEGVLVGYGVRFFTENIAGDVGFIRPIFFNDDNNDDLDFILGVPVVTFSYRW